MYVSERIRHECDFRWGLHNTKMQATERQKGRRVVAFDILAGYSCPAASICQSWAQKDGSVKLGKHAQFVCYAAKLEGAYPNSRRAHEHNFNLIIEMLREPDGDMRLADMLERDLRLLNPGIVRIHSSGDLFSAKYARAWVEVARRMPDVIFFGYTKVYSSYRMVTDVRLPNLGFAFSIGGRDDKFVQAHDVTCTVVTDGYALDESGKCFWDMNLEAWVPVICTNHDDDEDYSRDFDYIMAGKSFGIALH